jgi:hypothetical protein
MARCISAMYSGSFSGRHRASRVTGRVSAQRQADALPAGPPSSDTL